MKNNRQSWNDFLFENRNKAYGAYVQRTTAGRNLLKSLLVVVFSLGIAITALSVTSKDEPVIYKRNTPPIHVLAKIEEPPAEKPAVKPIEKTKPVITVKEKSGTDIVPQPTANPPVEHPLASQVDIGISEGDENTGDPNEIGAHNPGENTTGNATGVDNTPESSVPETPKTMNVKQVTKMAIYPGCEKSKNNDELTRCMAEKLSAELGVQLKDFEEIANSKGIEQANARLSFVVDEMGRIVQVRAAKNGDKELSAEAKNALDRISKKMVQKRKYIQPAEASDGSNVKLIFNLPVRYHLER
jgi:hypothetical protein